MEKERLKIQEDSLQAICYEVRRDVFKTILNAGSGHLGGCSSSVELLVSLYFGGHLRFDPKNPNHPFRDRVIIRGHEGPLRYKIFSMLGLFKEDQLSTYRQFGSILPGHEDMQITPGVDITPNGSLGMGLSYGVGAALSARNTGINHRVFVFLGDGEEQEGNISEAARHAASLGLDNLICILDKNQKQLSRPTIDSDGASNLEMIWKGYGWDVVKIKNGHDLKEINETFSNLDNISKPTMIIANTVKAYGVEGAEDNYCGYHTLSTCPPSFVEDAIERQQDKITETTVTEEQIDDEIKKKIQLLSLGEIEPTTKDDFSVDICVDPNNSTNLDNSQFTYFKGLREVLKKDGAPNFYVITPDFIRKDIVDLVGFGEFVLYYDVGIREQHAIAMAHGISISEPKARIFINYGDAFIYRASDQMNAVAQGGSKMILMSEFSGLTQERNGKTHQSSGQPGVILTMPGAFFYEPADVRDLFNILNWSITHNPGLVYIRSHRADIDLLEREESDKKNIDYYVTFEEANRPDLVIVSSGYVVSEAVKAAKLLKKEAGKNVRVINMVNPKAIDKRFLELIEEDIPVLTVYNGNPKHLQFVVSSAVLEHTGKKPSKVAGHGFEFGATGRFKDLLQYYQLDALGITEVSMSLLTS